MTFLDISRRHNRLRVICGEVAFGFSQRRLLAGIIEKAWSNPILRLDQGIFDRVAFIGRNTQPRFDRERRRARLTPRAWRLQSARGECAC